MTTASIAGAKIPDRPGGGRNMGRLHVAFKGAMWIGHHASVGGRPVMQPRRARREGAGWVCPETNVPRYRPAGRHLLLDFVPGHTRIRQDPRSRLMATATATEWRRSLPIRQPLAAREPSDPGRPVPGTRPGIVDRPPPLPAAAPRRSRQAPAAKSRRRPSPGSGGRGTFAAGACRPRRGRRIATPSRDSAPLDNHDRIPHHSESQAAVRAHRIGKPGAQSATGSSSVSFTSSMTM